MDTDGFAFYRQSIDRDTVMSKKTFIYLMGFVAGVVGMLAVTTILFVGMNPISLIVSLLVATIIWVSGKAIGELAE